MANAANVGGAGRNEVETVKTCEADLELFNQYSGQCWNDSSIVFLLFSNYLGDFTQRKVALLEDRITEMFNAFCRRNREFINHVAEHTLSDEELDNFVENAVIYIHCLQRRFKNWKQNALRAKSTVRPPLERCDSYLYSLCLEAAGPTANEYLFPVMQALESEAPGFANKPASEQESIKIRERLLQVVHRMPVIATNASKGYLEKAEEYRTRENRSVNKINAEALQFSNIRGYDSYRFSRLIAVLVYFFSDQTVTIGKLVQRELGGKPYYFLSDEQKNAFFYSKYPSLYIINRVIAPYEEDPDEKIINYPFLLKHPPELIISTNVSCYSVVETETIPRIRGHAITFLECGGKQFIYDDNVHSLTECKWRILFEEKYNMLYYCFHSRGIFSLVGVKRGEGSSAEVKIVWGDGSIQKKSFQRVAEPFGKQMYFFLKSKLGTGFIYIIDGFPFFIFDIGALPEPEPEAAAELKAAAEPEVAAEPKAAAEPEAAAKEHVSESNMNAEGFWYARPSKPEGGSRRRRLKRATRRAALKRRGRKSRGRR